MNRFSSQIEHLPENLRTAFLQDARPPQWKRFHEEWGDADEAGKKRLLAAFNALATDLEHNAVRFYSPQDIVVQWYGNGQFKLRIACEDAPSCRPLSPDRIVPALARRKLRRCFEEYRRRYGIAAASSAPQSASPSGDRVNILCLKWGDYYGPEYVNRLYAGVRRNLKRPFRFVCVTDNASGLAEGVEAVPIPDDPGVIGRDWPNIFVKLCLFKDGFADLEGPTLFLDIDVLVTGPLDRFFDFRPGEFCIIRNWVEWRKSLFSRLPLIGNSSCFRFDAGSSGAVYDTFTAEKDDTGEKCRFALGSQKFQTYAMRKTGNVNWWPDDWVCSFKRQLVPTFPLNKLLAPRRPGKDVSIVAFHGNPDIPQALEGYYFRHGRKVKPHLTCKPTKWIEDFWHE